jgi:ferrochelatase
MPETRVLLAAHGEAETTGFLDNFRISWHTLAHASEVMRLPAPLRVLICTFGGLRKRFGGGSGSPHNAHTRAQAAALEARLNADGAGSHHDPDDDADRYHYRVEPVFASAPPYLDDAVGLPEGVGRQLIVNMIPTDSRLSCGLGCHALLGESGAARERTRVIARFWESPELISVHCDHVAEHFPTIGSEGDCCLVLVLHGTVVRDEKGRPPSYHSGESEKTIYGEALKSALMARPDRPWQRVELAYLNHGVGGEWSSPTLPDLLTRLGEEGVGTAVAYACEHLVDGGETLGLKDVLAAGPVPETHSLPCLNANPALIEFLARRIESASTASPTDLRCDPCPLRNTPSRMEQDPSH